MSGKRGRRQGMMHLLAALLAVAVLPACGGSSGTDPDPPAENRRPSASPATATVVSESEITITLQANDPDGDLLEFSIISEPANGTVTAPNHIADNRAEVTYASDPDFTGTDTFTFSVSDGELTSPTAMVTVTVTEIELGAGGGF